MLSMTSAGASPVMAIVTAFHRSLRHGRTNPKVRFRLAHTSARLLNGASPGSAAPVPCVMML